MIGSGDKKMKNWGQSAVPNFLLRIGVLKDLTVCCKISS